jgi:hypothetical protein
MANLWNEVTTWLSEATRSAVKETEELARRGKIKFDMLKVSRELKDKFSELGGVVYELLQKDSRTSIKADSKVKTVALEIKNLEGELNKLKDQEKDLTASPGKKKTAKKQEPKKTGTKSGSAKKPAARKTTKKTSSGTKTTTQKKSRNATGTTAKKSTKKLAPKTESTTRKK